MRPFRSGRSASAFASIAAFLAFAAAPALAADPAPAKPPPAPAQEKAQKPKKDLVCTKEIPTGSIMPKRVCRTRAQVEADLRGVDDMNRDRQQVLTGRVTP
jgi:hypothetical protein